MFKIEQPLALEYALRYFIGETILLDDKFFNAIPNGQSASRQRCASESGRAKLDAMRPLLHKGVSVKRPHEVRSQSSIASFSFSAGYRSGSAACSIASC